MGVSNLLFFVPAAALPCFSCSDILKERCEPRLGHQACLCMTLFSRIIGVFNLHSHFPNSLDCVRCPVISDAKNSSASRRVSPHLSLCDTLHMRLYLLRYVTRPGIHRITPTIDLPCCLPLTRSPVKLTSSQLRRRLRRLSTGKLTRTQTTRQVLCSRKMNPFAPRSSP